MRMPRISQPIVGTSPGSALVAVLSAASLIAYLTFSRAVPLVIAGWSYLEPLLRAFLQAPQARVFRFDIAVTPSALTTSALFLASCIATGLLVARGMRGAPGAAPMGWVCGLSASVVPTMLLAAARWPDGGGSLTNQAICAAQLPFVAAAWLWARFGSSPPAASAPAVPRREAEAASWWLVAGVVLAVLYAAALALNGLTGLRGHDSFSQHLALAARWLVLGRIERGLPGEVITYYPGNFELLVRWTLSLGTDRFAFLLSFASAVLAVWVVHGIARTLGQSRNVAGMAALGAASLQVLAYQSIVVYSDTFTACCLLLATWLLLLWADDPRGDARLLLGLGLAVGLAFGTKYSAGPPAVVLGLAWLWVSWRRVSDGGTERARARPWRAVAEQAALMAAGASATMAYWYVRNAVEMGNPLYPLEVAGLPGIAMGDLLHGAPGPKTAWDQLTYPWVETGHGLGFETGLGPLLAAVGVLGVVVAPLGWRRRGRLSRLLWAVLAGAYAVWLSTGVLVPRYGFFPLLLTYVFVGELWVTHPSFLLRAVTVSAVTITMLAVGYEMVGGVAYSELTYDPSPRVPAVIDSLPASRILNVAGEPSGYYAMGRGYRHRVIKLFTQVTPADVRSLAPDYVLLPQSREAEFTGLLPLQLVGRAGSTATSLWRLDGAALASRH